MTVCPTCQRQFAEHLRPPASACPHDGSKLLEELQRYDSAPAALVGRVIGGRFLIERVLGEGGMGIVLAARHLTLGRRVAIKLLHPTLAAQPDIRGRFVREARTAAALDDARVATVSDFGETPSGIPFLVMELLEGEDLYSWSSARGSLPWRDAAWLGLHIVEILGSLHSRGLVHRDLKPENVWVPEPTGGPVEELPLKLLDFGVVALLDNDEDRRLTRTGTTVGTPTYMAPEQVRGDPVDARADLYALACVMWELLTGNPPYVARTQPDLFAQHLYDAVPSLRKVAPDAPAWLAELLEQSLAKDRAKRPADALTFARRLREGLARPVAEVPRAREAAAARTAPLASASGPAALPRLPRPAGFPRGLAVAAGVLLLGGVGFAVLRWPGDAGATPDAASPQRQTAAHVPEPAPGETRSAGEAMAVVAAQAPPNPAPPARPSDGEERTHRRTAESARRPTSRDLRTRSEEAEAARRPLELASGAAPPERGPRVGRPTVVRRDRPPPPGDGLMDPR